MTSYSTMTPFGLSGPCQASVILSLLFLSFRITFTVNRERQWHNVMMCIQNGKILSISIQDHFSSIAASWPIWFYSTVTPLLIQNKATESSQSPYRECFTHIHTSETFVWRETKGATQQQVITLLKHSLTPSLSLSSVPSSLSLQQDGQRKRMRGGREMAAGTAGLIFGQMVGGKFTWCPSPFLCSEICEQPSKLHQT